MKTGSKKFILVMVFILAVFGLKAYSEQTMSVGVIDPVKMMENSSEGQKVISVLKAKEQIIINELNQIDQGVQTIENKLRTQRLTLTLEAQQNMTLDIERLRTKRKRLEEDSYNDYKRLEFTLTNRIRQEVLPIIETVAKERGFKLVLDLSISGVAYFDNTIDITAEVAKRYDASKGSKNSGNLSSTFNLTKNLY
jgi:Skp family chaperone for outer membrane proteins